MNEDKKAVSEEAFQAYVDGRLEGAEHDRIAAAIANDAELARRAGELRSLDESMRATYDAALDEPLPPRILHAVMQGGSSIPLRIAAAIAWMAVGGVIGGVAVNHLAEKESAEMAAVRPLPREAAYAHTVYVPEVRHAVEVGADEQAHLNAWLSKRLAHPVNAPDIREIGYQLVGGRLLPDAGRPAAQFMYEDEHGGRITLYVRAHEERRVETALRHSQDEGVGVVYWLDGPLAYALAGNMDKNELEKVANAMYRALNP
ncbi:MAG: anti-sigma factor [Gammaproteobacteria bacterium]|nr:anti-sigma factor [Gammaproteobacteria bacterium]